MRRPPKGPPLGLLNGILHHLSRSGRQEPILWLVPLDQPSLSLIGPQAFLVALTKTVTPARLVRLAQATGPPLATIGLTRHLGRPRREVGRPSRSGATRARPACGDATAGQLPAGLDTDNADPRRNASRRSSDIRIHLP
jgi:hypothetical protein